MVLGGGAFGRDVSHEGGALMNGIDFYTRNSTGGVKPFLQVRTQQEGSYELERVPSSKCDLADAWVLDLTASRTMRNKYLLLVNM